LSNLKKLVLFFLSVWFLFSLLTLVGFVLENFYNVVFFNYFPFSEDQAMTANFIAVSLLTIYALVDMVSNLKKDEMTEKDK
jgi:hypothetical protein